jgi:hypothetical protein
MTPSNRVLSTLPSDVLVNVQRRFPPVVLPLGMRLGGFGEDIDHIVFPYSGMVSFVGEVASGMSVETGMVGNDGAVNGAAALGSKVSAVRADVQVAGQGTKLPAAEAAELAEKYAAFRTAIVKSQQVLLAQAQQSAVCFAAHRVEQRLCRWLLHLRDLTATLRFELTQEYLAQMLGVQRTSISLVAGDLQQAGIIAYRRGRIEILDQSLLERRACECYALVRSQRDAMKT